MRCEYFPSSVIRHITEEKRYTLPIMSASDGLGKDKGHINTLHDYSGTELKRKETLSPLCVRRMASAKILDTSIS